MNGHFAKHGPERGYKTAWGYTAGALRVKALATQKHALKSGGVAYRATNYRVVLTYNKKLTSYMKSTPRGWNKWLRR